MAGCCSVSWYASPCSSTPSYAAESPVTITFLHGWDRERTDLMNEVLHRFEEKYPWIKVDAHLVPTNDLGEQLTVLMAAGLPPDLTMVSGGNSVNLGVRGMLMPLGEFVAREQLVLDEIFYPPVANALVNNPIAGPGNFYYLPQLVYTNWYLFYNKGHFADAGLDVEAPPRTWSELEAIARRLNRADADGNWVSLASMSCRPPTIKCSENGSVPQAAACTATTCVSDRRGQ